MFVCTAQLCPVCQQGSIGFRISHDVEKIFAMCDECETIWVDPTKICEATLTFAVGPEFHVAELSINLKESHWATMEEISSHNLQGNVIKEAVPLGDLVAQHSRKSMKAGKKL